MNNPADTLAALAEKADAAYRAFKGAFDTPAAWRKDGSDYADDARQRLRDFFAEFAALASLKGEAEPRKPDGYAYRYPHHDGDTVIRFTCGQEINGARPIEAVPYFYGTPPAPQAAKLDRCPDCYRPKARNADDCAAGCCAKWYAVRDGEAATECAKLAAFWAAPQAVGYERGLETPRRMAAVELLQSQGWRWDKGGWQSPSPAPQGGGELRVRHIGGGLLALYRGDEQVREIGVTPGWDFRDRDEFIARYNATPPAQQPGEVGEGRLAEAIWLLHEVCKGLHGVGCGPCIGSHAPMENLHGLIARYLGRRPDKHCRHCDGSGTADMGGECPCVTYALAPKEKGNG